MKNNAIGHRLCYILYAAVHVGAAAAAAAGVAASRSRSCRRRIYEPHKKVSLYTDILDQDPIVE